jgi:2-phosphoglycolate phosphatase
MNLSDKKLILFDLDGTLIDSAPDLAQSVNFMLRELNRSTFSEDIIRSWVGNGAKRLVQRALDKESVDSELDIFLKHYSSNLCDKTKLYPNVLETLNTLKQKGHKLAIITNKPYDFIEPILKGLGISDLFDDFIGGDSLDRKKPDPLPLLYMCEKFGISVDKSVMIGDSKNDILAASAAGMDSIGVSYGYNYDESISVYEPDMVVDDFSTIIKPRVAVIGGGVAGSSVALYLGALGLDVVLFEKGKSLVNGPPMCHLHSGGNLYREISDEQCETLLRQSIDLLRFYPFSIDFRPTVIAIPTDDDGEITDILPRLNKLKELYKTLIKEDPKNRVLADVEDYFKLYSYEDVLKLKDLSPSKNPTTLDEWMIPVCKYIDLKKVKFPLLIVQEYGLNIFNLSAGITLALSKLGSVEVLYESEVLDLKKDGEYWLIDKDKRFDYLVNAAGFQTGKIDDLLGFKRDRMVEFKAAYVTKWKSDVIFPEVIFHGKRGTPKGMAQFTPYPDGYFQLHGMTKSATLFHDGLVATNKTSSQPKLSQKFINKIESKWNEDDIKSRTDASIKHLCQYIPAFCDAKVASKPLYGAQQIPGDDPDLRAADVSFEGEKYARCEIVKASSVLDAIDEIVKKLIDLGFVDKDRLGEREFEVLRGVGEDELISLSKKLAKDREYPTPMANRVISKR